jgi:hypothetical protein
MRPEARERLWDYDFRLIFWHGNASGNLRRHDRTAAAFGILDSPAKCSKHLRERENTFMSCREFDIAASYLSGSLAGLQACFAHSSKTKAKTTTKTV